MAGTRNKALLTGCLVAGGVAALGGMVLVIVGALGGVAYYVSRQQARSASVAAVSELPPLGFEESVAVMRRPGATPAEQARALAGLELAATRGNTKAMVMAAACYRVGLGAQADDQLKAFEWTRKAAAAGEPEAMIEMARYTTDGVWVEANPSAAEEWLRKAAAAGSAEAKWQLEQGGT